MKKHIGSTIALCFGILSIMAGLTKALKGGEGVEHGVSMQIAGLIIVIGALAYRSAKKRKLGSVSDSIVRLVFEIVGITVCVLLFISQNNLKYLIAIAPVPNLAIPLWVLIAYLYISLRKTRHSESNVN